MSEPLDRIKSALADHYRIERQIGKGGMATVFLAQDVRHDRQVAVKVLRSDVASELGGDRFIREIKLAARLTHPHILPLFDSGEAGGFLYFVMPLMEGESLRDRLHNAKQLPVEEAMQVARQIADALDYAHRHDVVHRDIKPENIMLHDGHAVVADFGIGKAVTAASENVESITRTGVTVGTPAYMSPEQASGEGEIDGRSDLYSLGCVIYEMLTGEQPFTGPTAQAVIAKRFTITPPEVTQIRDSVPRSVSHAVGRLLARTPADRYATGAHLIRELQSGEVPARSAPAADEKSIAVLPFENMSADPDNEYFADGITDELISVLSKFQGLHVVARTSAFAFKGKHEDLRVIGERLGVSKVVEGSVRKAGQRLRITTQLVNVADGYHLWSERYDRQLDDIFAVQDEIATAIAGQLQVVLGGDTGTQLVKPGTDDLQAYQLYLKGRYFWNQRGAALATGLKCFEQALERDPEYAAAHAGVADSLTLLVLYGIAPPRDALARARQAADRSLELDDTLAEAHNAFAFVTFLYDWDWWATREHLNKAIELNPRYVAAIYWRGACGSLAGTSALNEAVADAERAVSIDPLAFHPRIVLSWVHIIYRQFAQAIPHLEQVVELQTTFLGQWLLGLAHRFLGHLDRAVSAGEAAVEISSRHPWTVADLGITYHALGRTADAQALYDELNQRAESQYVQVSQRAILAANLGHTQEAFALLSTAVDERDGFLPFVNRWPTFDPLRDDPRFDAILSPLGLPVSSASRATG